MNPHALTADTLSALAGILISLVFSYVPKVKDWFDKQPGATKRLVVLGSLLVTTAGALAISCTNLVQPGAACTQTTIVDAVAAFIAALVANQSAYQFQPQPKAAA